MTFTDDDGHVIYSPLTRREARLIAQRVHGKRPFPDVPEDVSFRVQSIVQLLDRLPFIERNAAFEGFFAGLDDGDQGLLLLALTESNTQPKGKLQ